MEGKGFEVLDLRVGVRHVNSCESYLRRKSAEST